jgi:L-lactate dehydrogenase complex protein LldE
MAAEPAQLAVNVSLFITCYNDTLFPRRRERRWSRCWSGWATPWTSAGADLLRPDALQHRLSGRRAAHDAALLDVFRDAETICVPSASCVAMMREHFPKMAARCPDASVSRDVEDLLPRVYEFCELLVNKLRTVDTGATFRTP